MKKGKNWFLGIALFLGFSSFAFHFDHSIHWWWPHKSLVPLVLRVLAIIFFGLYFLSLKMK